jgi:hypothetical protein
MLNDKQTRSDGSSKFAKKQNVYFPISKGNTIIDINIVLDKIANGDK